MDQPGALLSNLLNRTQVDRATRRRLNNTFQVFLTYYGAVRHFGRNKDDQNYRTVGELTLSEVNRFRLMTIEIWDVILAMYRDDEENDLNEASSVSEVVWFKELAEQTH